MGSEVELYLLTITQQREKIKEVVDENARLSSELAGMREALEWALGERGTFPPQPLGSAGKRARLYWWRSELRKRMRAATAAAQALNMAPKMQEKKEDEDRPGCNCPAGLCMCGI